MFGLPPAISEIRKARKNTNRRYGQQEDAFVQHSRSLDLLGCRISRTHYALQKQEHHRQISKIKSSHIQSPARYRQYRLVLRVPPLTSAMIPKIKHNRKPPLKI